MTELPDPPVPADADLSDFPFMPVEVARLQKSRQWLIAKRHPEIGFYSINLWLASWHERPAGSLEDDDEMLADRAMCSPRRWAKVKEEVLRGWQKCSDGRLYHPVVCEKVQEAWNDKIQWRNSRAAFRKVQSEKGKKSAKARLKNKGNSEPGESSGSTSVQPEGNRAATEGQPDSTNKGRGTGKGTGKKESQTPPPPPSLDAARDDHASPKAEPVVAVAVVDRFKHLRKQHWPTESRFPAPDMTLRREAEQLLEKGGPPDLIAEVLDRQMAKAAGSGDSAPNSFQAYRHSLNRAIRSHNSPIADLDGPPRLVNGNGAADPPKRKSLVVGSPEEQRFRRENLGMDLDAFEAKCRAERGEA